MTTAPGYLCGSQYVTCQTLSEGPLSARSDDATSFLLTQLPGPTQESLEFGVSHVKEAETNAAGCGGAVNGLPPKPLSLVSGFRMVRFELRATPHHNRLLFQSVALVRIPT